ncbi:two-component regulator propeller domain-containing protein, partial [Pseudomonadota bacterium]
MKITCNGLSSPGRMWRTVASGILLLLISTSPARAQQKLIQFQHIDPATSFATQSILAVTQDEQGFLWFASLYGGVARYDGYEFKIYQHDPGDPNSLPTNEIHSLYADKNGVLWIGTAEGLVLLDTKSDRITVFRHEAGNPQSLSHSGVAPILRDSQGILWVGTENGLNRQEPGANDFTYYPLNFENSDPNIVTPAQWVWSLFEDSAGNLWIGTLGGGLLLYDRASDSFTRFLNDPENPESLPHNVVRDITEDHFGHLWVATTNGIGRLEDTKSARFA